MTGFVFALIVIANSAPVIARKLLGDRANWPMDGGCRWIDGQPLLGRAKTWRGVVSGLLLGTVAGFLLPISLWHSWLIILAALGGDVLSSFVKRRLQLPPSSRAPILDQLPEVLIPALLGQFLFGYTGWATLIMCIAFTLGNMGISPWLYRRGWRNKPY